MKPLAAIKNTLANLTDRLASVAAHVPPIAHVTVSNPRTGSAVTLTPQSPFTLTPRPIACPHCGK